MGYPGGCRQHTLGSAAVDDGYGPPVIVLRSSRLSRRREFPDIEKPEALGVTLFRAGTDVSRWVRWLIQNGTDIAGCCEE